MERYAHVVGIVVQQGLLDGGDRVLVEVEVGAVMPWWRTISVPGFFRLVEGVDRVSMLLRCSSSWSAVRS